MWTLWLQLDRCVILLSKEHWKLIRKWSEKSVMLVPTSEIWQVEKLTNIRSRVLPLICVGSVINCSNPWLMRKFNIRTESDEWLWYVSQFTSGMIKSPQITVGRLLFWLITCERKLMISKAVQRNLLEKGGYRCRYATGRGSRCVISWRNQNRQWNQSGRCI